MTEINTLLDLILLRYYGRKDHLTSITRNHDKQVWECQITLPDGRIVRVEPSNKDLRSITIDLFQEWLKVVGLGKEFFALYHYAQAHNVLIDVLERSIIESEERTPVTKEDMKKSLQKLLKIHTIEEVSKRIGKDIQWINSQLT